MSARRRGIARLVSELRVFRRVQRDELAVAVVVVLELRVLEPWAVRVPAAILPRTTCVNECCRRHPESSAAMGWLTECRFWYSTDWKRARKPAVRGAGSGQAEAEEGRERQGGQPWDEGRGALSPLGLLATVASSDDREKDGWGVAALTVVVAAAGAGAAEVLGAEDGLEHLHQGRGVDHGRPLILQAKVRGGGAEGV